MIVKLLEMLWLKTLISIHVEGDLQILNELKITSTASITCNIVTGSISVASGAVLNATISIKR